MFTTRVSGRNILFLIVTLVIFVAAFAFGVHFLWRLMTDGENPNPATITSIPLVGLLLFVALVALLVLIYKLTGMADKTEALGLPSGSVRALIAVCLVLMFGSLGVFIQQRLGTPIAGIAIANADKSTVDKLIKKFGADNVIAVAISDRNEGSGAGSGSGGGGNPSGGHGSGGGSGSGGGAGSPRQTAAHATTPAGGTPPATGPDATSGSGSASSGGRDTGRTTNTTSAQNPNQLYNVTYFPPANKDADDFGKLFFEKLAIVFASVVAFYFGSSTTAAGVTKGISAAQNNSTGTPVPPNPPDVPGALLQIKALVGSATTDVTAASQAFDKIQALSPPSPNLASAQDLNKQITDAMAKITALNTSAQSAANIFGTAPTPAANTQAVATILDALDKIKVLAASIHTDTTALGKLT